MHRSSAESTKYDVHAERMGLACPIHAQWNEHIRMHQLCLSGSVIEHDERSDPRAGLEEASGLGSVQEHRGCSEEDQEDRRPDGQISSRSPSKKNMMLFVSHAKGGTTGLLWHAIGTNGRITGASSTSSKINGSQGDQVRLAKSIKLSTYEQAQVDALHAAGISNRRDKSRLVWVVSNSSEFADSLRSRLDLSASKWEVLRGLNRGPHIVNKVMKRAPP
ncbi:hypothetical protein RB195_025385 [Necator americanus]|uniref:Uncharacterized protein n=1 Tax=Necator americanus TaxID=51031 RepID=A0ABR1ES25_NECAM